MPKQHTLLPLLLTALLFGCHKTESSSPSSSTSSSAAPAATTPATAPTPGSASSGETVKVGLVTALSGQSASAGEAITRGLTLAINEINAKGGVLGGRKIELIRRDDQSSPSVGQSQARELMDKDHVAAIFGGIDSPVSLAIVPIANQKKTIYMGTWGADTAITRNNANPNYIFRVSGVDDLVDKFLVNYAKNKGHAQKGGMMLIDNAWGESNKTGLTAALTQAGMGNAGAEKFQDQDVDMVPQLSRLKGNGADSIFLVASAAAGAQTVKAMQRMGWNAPVISHWGISGGRFPELAGPATSKVVFVQTYSFMGPQNDVGKKVIQAYESTYGVKSPAEITSPVGVANAYDAMHLVAMAIDKAGSTDGDAIREAFYKIGPYHGLIKDYAHPFTQDNHDALTENDYVMCHYVGNDIVPVGK